MFNTRFQRPVVNDTLSFAPVSRIPGNGLSGRFVGVALYDAHVAPYGGGGVVDHVFFGVRAQP